MRRSYLFFLLVGFLTLALDQVTKQWAVDTLKPLPFRSEEHTVLSGPWGVGLGFSYAENPGATFSFMRDVPEYVRLPFFALIAAGAAIGISIYYGRLKGRKLATRTALALLWAGALGNLVDRLRFRYVVDFIDVYLAKAGATQVPPPPEMSYTWPTFNVADIAIVVGILLFLFWGQPEDAKKEPKKA
jgi:signal peptidase II